MAALCSAAWWSLHQVIAEQDSIAAVVNVSGRQRMLSQRTALFAVMLKDAPAKERPAIRADLKKAIDRMERSHQGLIHGDIELALPATMSDTVRSLYFEGPEAVDALVTSHIAAARELLLASDDGLTSANTQLQYVVQQASYRLIHPLDKMVRQYQLEGEATVARLHRVATTVWALSVLLLVLEGLWIFRPFERRLARTIGALEATKLDLQQHQNHLEDLINQRTKALQSANDALQRKEQEVRNLALHDELTGLPNRRLLHDRLGSAMATSQREGHYGALIFLDLDNFKPLNDTHGHVVGDLLLIEVARRLAACLREIDTPARFGGDEFVVMLNKLATNKAEAIEQARGVAKKIQASLAAPYHLDTSQTDSAIATLVHHSSASLGVAMFKGHESTASEILKCADMSMYQAKKAGRNTIQFHGEGLQTL